VRKLGIICKEELIGAIIIVKAKESHGSPHSLYAQKLKYCGGSTMIHLGVYPIDLVSWFKEKNLTEVIGKTSKGEEKD